MALCQVLFNFVRRKKKNIHILKIYIHKIWSEKLMCVGEEQISLSIPLGVVYFHHEHLQSVAAIPQQIEEISYK